MGWRNYTILINCHRFPWICSPLWSNEFLGSNGYHKHLESLSQFNRVVMWWLLCAQSYFKKIFCFSLRITFCSPGICDPAFILLHYHSSNNPLRINTNNKIPFFPFVFIKDFFSLLLVLTMYFLQCHFGISTLSHPDNAL